MVAYPGYTVAGIQRELSWRQVQQLFDQWDNQEPGFVMLRQTRNMVARHTGHKVVQRKQVSDEALVQKLQGLGWLPGD